MQKVHLWMEISADCPNRGRRSLTKMDRLRNVQSSVWTLQQILPDKLQIRPSITTLLSNHPEGNLFAESPPLDGLWQTYFMELDTVQSDKNTCSYCPEQRVDAATDIVRQTILFYMYKKSGYIAFESLHNH